MASMFEQPQEGTLFLGGKKFSGSDIRDQNGKHPVPREKHRKHLGLSNSAPQSPPRKLSQMSSGAPSALAASTR